MSWSRPSTSSQIRAGGLFLLAITLASCTEFGRGCTDIGSSTGIGVTVDRSMTSGLDRLELRVCPAPGFAQGCASATVRLDPGSDSVDQGCDGTDPDSVCSATVVPNGSSVGFVDISWLTAGPVRVTATTTGNGQRRTYPTVTVAAEDVYPNGRDCGSTGRQAHIVLRSDGLH